MGVQVHCTCNNLLSASPDIQWSAKQHCNSNNPMSKSAIHIENFLDKNSHLILFFNINQQASFVNTCIYFANKMHGSGNYLFEHLSFASRNFFHFKHFFYTSRVFFNICNMQLFISLLLITVSFCYNNQFWKKILLVFFNV